MATGDAPLDFEVDDPLLSPAPAKKRRKIIDLDDLLNDFCTGSKGTNMMLKCSKVPEAFGTDDEIRIQENEMVVRKFVDDVENQVKEMDSGDDVSEWGLNLFGCQASEALSYDSLKPESCEILKFLTDQKFVSLLGHNAEQGETFLESLLINGWLAKLVFKFGYVEGSIAAWTFTEMLYSVNKKLSTACCDFWCSMLQQKEEMGVPLVRLGWLPNYEILKKALVDYGYRSEISTIKCFAPEAISSDSLREGPPRNIISWFRVVSLCSQYRNAQSMFLATEAQDLLVIVTHIFLDRKLEGLTCVMKECMLSLISYFQESEWDARCFAVAKSIVHSIPKDLNSIRVVESIPVVDCRCKCLRSQLALQLLSACFNLEHADDEEAISFLMKINARDKDCNFFNLYLYLVLTENVLICSKVFEEKPALIGSLRDYLRSCSSQIGCSDWRSYASKVRNKASYLVQNVILRRAC